jgi:3-mercaptopyruvate sulfurtransferase SseA
MLTGTLEKFSSSADRTHLTKMLPVADYFNTDKTFKSADEIKRMLSYLDIRPEQQVLTHCGGGIAASVPFFVLKFMLNYPKVKLFTESQLGWISDARELPLWTYDAPFLMRESNWLQSWGGKMFRMYGISQVSIVDVRSADAFSQGHLPFHLTSVQTCSKAISVIRQPG